MRFISRQDRSEVQPNPQTVSPRAEVVGQLALSHPAEIGKFQSVDLISSPEVNDMVYKASTRRLITVEDFQQKLESGPMERVMKRRLIGNGVPQYALEVSKSLAAILAQPGTYKKGYVPERDMVGRSMLSAYANQLPPYLKGGAVLEDIFKAAAELEPLIVYYREKSRQLSGRISSETQHDRQARYILAKELGSEVEEMGDGDEKVEGAVWLRRMLYNPELNGDGFTAKLVAEVKSGEFDDFLAREIVTKESDSKIIGILDLFKSSLGRELSEQEIERFCNSTGLWPQEAHEELTESRANLLHGLQQTEARVLNEVQVMFGNLSSQVPPEESFKKSMERLLYAAKNLKGPVATDKMPQVLRKRVSGQSLHSSRSTPSARAEVQETKREVDNKLLVVDSLGNTSDEESPKFSEITERVLQDYRGTPGLTDDLANIMRYLKKVDLQDPSKLQRAGLAKMAEGNVKVQINGELKQAPLYRFKPIEAAGLSIKTPIMKRQRVYLGMVDRETLAILGIVHRDTSNKFLANMGIGTGQKR